MKTVYLIVLIAAASTLTLLVGETAVSPAKLGGLAVALATFLPVFLLLRKSVGNLAATGFLALFVGGFIYKLTVILVGVWVAVSVLEWQTVDYVVANMSLLIALQIFESIYFLGKSGESPAGDEPKSSIEQNQ